MSPLLKALRETQEFQSIMDALLQTRPVIPNYAPQKTRDQTENLLEQFKHQSAMRQGWDLLYQHLVGKQP